MRREKFPIVCGLDTSTLSKSYLAMLKAGGVDCWHKSTGSVQTIGEILEFIGRHPDDMAAASTVREIRAAYERGKIAVVFGTQSAQLVENALGGEGATGFSSPIAEKRVSDSLRYQLRGFHALGLRIVGIAYNVPNGFGSGNFYPYLPLTPAGRKLVEDIHDLRILLDVGGHSGEQTSLDAIAMAPEIPVICSHTNIQALVDNPRNISDRLIDAIAKTGGVIGVTAVNDFHVRTRYDLAVAHSPRRSIDDMIIHLEYLKRRVGVDHIGLGPDFVEGRGLNYDQMNRTAELNRSVLSDGPWLYVKDFENISMLSHVIRRMSERGWSEPDVAKVMGGNWLRVYERAWGA